MATTLSSTMHVTRSSGGKALAMFLVAAAAVACTGADIDQAEDAVGETQQELLPATALSAGLAATGVAGTRGSMTYFRLPVLAGSTSAMVQPASEYGGNINNVEIYVKFGALPTTTSYDYSSIGKNGKQVPISNPAKGHWYIGLYGINDYTDLGVRGDYGLSTYGFPSQGTVVSTSPASFTPSIFPGFESYNPQVDWYKVALPAGNTLNYKQVYTPQAHTSGLKVVFYDTDTLDLLGTKSVSGSSTITLAASYVNTSAAARNVSVLVNSWESGNYWGSKSSDVTISWGAGGGATCTPTTCQAQGKNCGSISDGCGGTLACGTCSTGTCGGSGVANVCGSPTSPPPPPPSGGSATLTLTASGRSGERVSSTPAGLSVATGSNGSASFAVGSSVKLAVSNGRSAIFSGACSSGGVKRTSCTFTLQANASVTANVQ